MCRCYVRRCFFQCTNFRSLSRILRLCVLSVRRHPATMMVPARLMRDGVRIAGVIGVEIAGVVWRIGWEGVVQMWSGVAKYFLKKN